MSEAFATAWLVIKGRPHPFAFHFTDRKNVPGIMREGLDPSLMGSGKGVHPGSRPKMDDLMHDWSDEEMDGIAQDAGYRDKADLYEGDWTWAMEDTEDGPMYADMIDDPVMIAIKPDNEGRWVRNWEWAHNHHRTRDRINPKHLEVIDFAGSRNQRDLEAHKDKYEDGFYNDLSDNNPFIDMLFQDGGLYR